MQGSNFPNQKEEPPNSAGDAPMSPTLPAIPVSPPLSAAPGERKGGGDLSPAFLVTEIPTAQLADLSLTTSTTRAPTTNTTSAAGEPTSSSTTSGGGGRQSAKSAASSSGLTGRASGAGARGQRGRGGYGCSAAPPRAGAGRGGLFEDQEDEDENGTGSQQKPSAAQVDTAIGQWITSGRGEGYVANLKHTLQQQLLEGHGECMVKLGVDSQGHPVGLQETEYMESLANLVKLAAEINASTSTVIEISPPGRASTARCGEVLVRRSEAEHHPIDMRICICGNVDSGKSTFVGVCTKGILDDGRGSVRSKVFRFKHEQETGRTSAISEQLLGFDSTGHVVNYPQLHSSTSEATTQSRTLVEREIAERSAKIITFFDLAGHEKYLKTTVLGMVGSTPDYACLVISANNGVQRMTKEHLGLCLALKIPFFIAITRIDSCPTTILQNTTDDIVKILKHPKINKRPYIVRELKDVVICSKNIKEDRLVPIFHVSNVTAENMSLLLQFLNLVPIRKDWSQFVGMPSEVVIDSTFYVTGVGTVVGGLVSQGMLRPNDTVLLGPNSNGLFRQATIKSIHVKQCNVNVVEAGMAACFALKKERRSDIRRGMVMVDVRSKPEAVWTFEAEVVVLYHSTTIQTNYQPVVHCGSVRQSSSIILTDREVLRTGDKARVRFKFLYRPEYIKVGSKLIFREGRTKGLGTVTMVGNLPEMVMPPPGTVPVTRDVSTDSSSSSSSSSDDSSEAPPPESTTTSGGAVTGSSSSSAPQLCP